MDKVVSMIGPGMLFQRTHNGVRSLIQAGVPSGMDRDLLTMSMGIKDRSIQILIEEQREPAIAFVVRTGDAQMRASNTNEYV